MKNFIRTDLKLSLCGLNCSLCTMKLDNYCPGCGGGAGNPGCTIARCSLQHQSIDYCFQCKEYPCSKYNDIEQYDSFITHRNQLKDMLKAQAVGIEKYHLELNEKAQILRWLLKNYNDGRRKTFFCIAINLLELEDIRMVIEKIKTEIPSNDMSIKEKALIAVTIFQALADERNIILKLYKKPSKK
ncbi:DUF3795 domain-containing protein [Paludicola sp. MB14-C6]|uniref:DUF3795 domain-containing protein n=1 Tax=Paludihabitans sp. MB14-C6 TaxID=3070656 RepID=UPI0027DCCD53|nr:DUF3795 domain-containing protein [Paludicola sp. MB14-C6]WMJ22495.1 DUF3795 domain-containing protein [Paludicola sp. MB14-C6]